MALKNKISQIKMLICDVDGVLTDGKIIYDSDGRETKNFDVQDGLGLVLLHKLGFKLAIISARESKVARQRSKELNIDHVYVGVRPKLKAYEDLLKKVKFKDKEICFVGDDLPDIGVLKRVGFAVAVKNAVEDVKKVSHYVTKRSGGDGAVREVVEMILKGQGLWSKALKEM